MIYNETRYNAHWNTKKLSELGEFARGKSKHRPRNDAKLFENGKYPLIQTGDVKAANFMITKHEQEYSDFGLQQSKLWDAGTLCITIAANIAETGILAYPMCFPDSVVGFNAYPTESSEEFMHYVFTFIRNSIQNSVNGSIQDNINIEYLTGLDFKVPDKIYQDKIVHTLSLLDKKIELNHRIISELEDMAKTIYEYWFVQFDFPNDDGKPYRSSGGEMAWNEQLNREIPKGWRVSLLSTLGEFKNGINYDKDTCNGKTVKIINVRDISSSSSVLLRDTLDDISLPQYEIEKYLVEKNDILIARSGIPGATRFMPQDTINTIYCGFIIRFRVENEMMKMYLYFRLKDIEQISLSQSGGTILKNISQDTLKDIMTVKPEDTVLTAFYNLVKPILNMQINKSTENQELIKLRDWLLPMLMNGQVTVE